MEFGMYIMAPESISILKLKTKLRGFSPQARVHFNGVLN
jgi:hypothetical protein